MVKRLEGRLNAKLEITHVESPGIRGIDTSLLYSADRVELAAGAEPVGHGVSLIYPMPDIF